MKKTIRIYLNTLFLFLIPFVVVSLILALLSYFIQLNSFVTQVMLQIISYVMLLIASLYLTSQLEKNRLLHCCCLSFLYFILSLLIHLGHLNYFHLFFKSFLFLFVGIIKEVRAKIVA